MSTDAIGYPGARAGRLRAVARWVVLAWRIAREGTAVLAMLALAIRRDRRDPLARRGAALLVDGTRGSAAARRGAAAGGAVQIRLRRALRLCP